LDLARRPVKEIERIARNVQPGAWAIDTEQPLSTLLGSCIAVCLFDPFLKIGGINHFMLPEMGHRKHGDVDSLLSGNFAMEALLNALLVKGAKKVRLQAKAFGGGRSLILTEVLGVSACATPISPRNGWHVSLFRCFQPIFGALVAQDCIFALQRRSLLQRTVTNMATAEVIAREERAYAETLQSRPKSSGKKIELF